MFRRRRQRRFLPWTFLVLLLGFQASSAFAGLNLCIGEHGHLEIESQEADCCPSRQPLEQAPMYVQVHAQTEGDCASCIDVSLGSGASTTLAKTESNCWKGCLPLASVLERLQPFPSRARIEDRGLPQEPGLTALRSVVLRV